MAEQTESARVRRRRARRRRTIAIAAGLTVAAGGSAVGFAATTGGPAGLRVATAADASVTQTVESSGTITSSLKLTPSFAQSGTIKSVDVKVGQTVAQGQTLAQLDTTGLRAALDSANATLANDKQQLQADETGQTSIGSGGGSSGTSGASGGSAGSGTSGASGAAGLTATAAGFVQLATPPSSGAGLSSLDVQIQSAQRAVVAAQRHVDSGQSAVDAAQKTVDADVSQNTGLRDAQQSACSTTATASPTASASPGTSSNPSQDCSTATAAYASFADTLASDMAVLDSKITTQDGYTHDVQQAITKLDGLIAKLKSASNTGGSSSASAQPGGTGTTGSAGTGSASGTTPTTGASGQGTSQAGLPASAAQIAADQAAIDAAQAEVAVADQNLAAATLASPIAGKVAAVGMTAGNSSSGQTITILGTGVQGVAVTVPLGQIGQVKAGQTVTVSPDGRTTVLHGTVRSVGLLSTTSGSATTFPVTIELDAGSPPLYDGTGASVVITTATAAGVITVPNSAIHTGANGTHTVTVVDRGKTSDVRVTLGIAGADVTQIKSGLTAGQQVVLADLSQPLPSSTTANTGAFRPGQFGGGGFGGGGVGGTGGRGTGGTGGTGG